ARTAITMIKIGTGSTSGMTSPTRRLAKSPDTDPPGNFKISSAAPCTTKHGCQRDDNRRQAQITHQQTVNGADPGADAERPGYRQRGVSTDAQRRWPELGDQNDIDRRNDGAR